MTSPTIAPKRNQPPSDLRDSSEAEGHFGVTESGDPTESRNLGEAPPPASFREGLLFNVVIPLVLLAGAVIVFTMLGSVQSAQRPSADMSREGRLRALTPVRVTRLQTLESAGVPLFLTVDGTVVPYREAKVAAEVAGRIVFKSEDCEAGNYVKRDQLLMQIDPTDHELEVQRLTRLREQEYQALHEIDQEMANVQRVIDVAKKDVELQKRDVERQTSLPEGFASRAEIDQAGRSLLAATQQLVSAENQLELQRKRRVRLEASERLAATQLQGAELNLKRTEIRAPIDGVIVSEDADLNTFVARGNGLLTIEDTSKVEVATSLRMDQLYWVLNQRGERPDETSRSYDLPETPAIIEYELTGRDQNVYRWQGRLLSYDGIGLDSTTRTVPVRVVVDDPTAFVDENGNAKKANGTTPLVRGMFVRVRLQITPQTPLMVIPSTALQPGNRIFQFVPDPSVLEIDAETAAPATPPSSDSAAAAPSPAEELESVFEPERWDPGRVVMRRSVYPVDALSIQLSDHTASDQVAPSDAQRKYWVCEVGDAELSDDSFVVVSPLGDFDQESLPVRADRTSMGSGSTSSTAGVAPVEGKQTTSKEGA